MIQHIVTLYYPPTEEAKKVYEQMKSEGQSLHIINAGSLKDSDDEWVRQNCTLETSKKENIADRNPNMCEMTALYFVWKNLLDSFSDEDWVQHSHYRKVIGHNGIDLSENLYSGYVVAPIPMIFNVGDGGNTKTIQTNIEGGSNICHPKWTWSAMEEVILGNLNWRDSQAWCEWKKLRVMPAPLNLFMLKKPLFKEYCDWVFPLVFDIDKKIPYDREEYKTAYQRRAISFVGERLFSFWCYMKTTYGVLFQCSPVKIYEGFKPITDQEEREIKI